MSQISLSFVADFFSQKHLLIILGIVSALFIVVSIVLYYHWRKYSDRTEMMILFETAYLSVGVFLFTSALIVIGIL